MCQTCGCSPCQKCGRKIERGVCDGCNKSSFDCVCEKDQKDENDQEDDQ